MNKFTVEETNLICIYIGGTKQELTHEITAALSFMDEDMKELARRTLAKLEALTEAEYTELAAFAADEV